MELIKLEYFDALNNNEKKELTFSKDLLKKPYNEKSLFVSCVEGKSMQPLINDRALVISDLSNKVLLENSIYLINKDGNMWIKMAKKDKTNEDKFIFVSVNNDFSHLIYKEDDVHIIAKTLFTFTNL